MSSINGINAPGCAIVYRGGKSIAIYLLGKNNNGTWATPLSLVQGGSPVDVTFQIGDRVDLYRFSLELGFIPIAFHDIVAADIPTLTFPDEELVLPKKADNSEYTWPTSVFSVANGLVGCRAGRIRNLGCYAGWLSGHDYENVLAVTGLDYEPIVVTIGADVYLIFAPVTGIDDSHLAPVTCDVTVFTETYSINATSPEIGEPSTLTVECDGALDLRDVQPSTMSDLAVPILIPHTFSNELATINRCSYEPAPRFTFLRGNREHAYIANDAVCTTSFDRALISVLTQHDSGIVFTGCEYSTAAASYDTHTLDGFVGDVVSYVVGDISGSFIMGPSGSVIDLRADLKMVVLTVIASHGVIVESNMGEIIPGDEVDTFVVSAHPGTEVSLQCLINNASRVKTLIIPDADTTLDWVTSPWWSVVTDEQFTPEARLIKLHVVNYAHAGAITLRVKKSDLIPTYETIVPTVGTNDYYFDIDRYGAFGPWLTKKFVAYIDFPDHTDLIDITWPEASEQWTIVYGSQNPVDPTTGAELGFIIINNPTSDELTAYVRTNLVLNSFDTLGVIPARSTMTYPILDSYLSSALLGERRVVRCKLVGSNGTYEADKEYPDSHFVTFDYPSTVIEPPPGTFDWDKVKIVLFVAVGCVVSIFAVSTLGRFLSR